MRERAELRGGSPGRFSRQSLSPRTPRRRVRQPPKRIVYPENVSCDVIAYAGSLTIAGTMCMYTPVLFPVSHRYQPSTQASMKLLRPAIVTQ